MVNRICWVVLAVCVSGLTIAGSVATATPARARAAGSVPAADCQPFAGRPCLLPFPNNLFTRPDPNAGDFVADLNPQSVEVLSDCRLEPALADAVPGVPVQFERQGYFCRDEGAGLVFNRTIGLRDSWAKTQGGGG